MVIDGYWTCGDHFVMYLIVRSLCCTPETNLILYINYISIKNIFVYTHIYSHLMSVVLAVIYSLIASSHKIWVERALSLN